MPLTKFTADVSNISKLPNQPREDDGYTPDSLKHEFDKAGEDIQEFINNTFIPELEDAIAAAARGVTQKGFPGDGITDDTITASKLCKQTGRQAVTRETIRPQAVSQDKLSSELQALLSGFTTQIADLFNTVNRKVSAASLKEVAFSGSYSDLTDKPDIPVIDSEVVADSEHGLQSKVIQELLAEKSPTDHASEEATYGVGNGTNYGHLKLYDGIDSDSGVGDGVAAVPASVKRAYDLAATKQAQHSTATASLASGNNSWTVSVAEVSATSTLICTPAPDSYAQWVDNRVRCTAQADGQLSFVADSTTSQDIGVNILILD